MSAQIEDLMKPSPAQHGVEIVLERMKLYPDEFHPVNSKWSWLVAHLFPSSALRMPAQTAHVLVGLNEDELDALREGYAALCRDRFTTMVLKSLGESGGMPSAATAELLTPVQSSVSLEELLTPVQSSVNLDLWNAGKI